MAVILCYKHLGISNVIPKYEGFYKFPEATKLSVVSVIVIILIVSLKLSPVLKGQLNNQELSTLCANGGY